MFNRHLIAVVRWLPRQLHRINQRFTRIVAAWLLRYLFRMNLRAGNAPQGFILPTTVLLLMVVSLAVGAITLRSYERTTQVSNAREQQVIYNVATPALDRARSKLEYLFQSDPRMPSGIPGETVIRDLLNDGTGLMAGVTGDAYTIPGETRLDMDGDGSEDAAWTYLTDTDGDGVDDAAVAYSLIFDAPNPGETHPMSDSSDVGVAARASRLQIRNAPLSGAIQLEEACQFGPDAATGSPIEEGWFPDPVSTAVLRKNFQVDVYVLPDDPKDSVSTLEFHQDRQLNKGNKWGAWFRNDLELHPGPQFNWNGAMHTEGNFMVGWNDRFSAYLVSAPKSCLYKKEASEITIAKVLPDADQQIPAFEGQIISGTMANNAFAGRSRFHLHDNPPTTAGDDNTLLDRNRDSVVNTGIAPADVMLDPLVLKTQDVSVARNVTGGNPTIHRDATWNPTDKNFVKAGRIYNQSEPAPYLDDFFRADNRYGPKPRYDGKQIPGTIGGAITGEQLKAEGLSDDMLIKSNPSSVNTAAALGLDGYWERRGRAEGLRLIVGERLELGNPVGWGGLAETGQPNGGDDPLEPWESCAPGGIGVNNNRCHEARQRRMLRDNLAAVQATAVYHTNVDTTGDSTTDSSDWDIPAACLASTVHPGTWQTVANGATFRDFTKGLEIFWDDSLVDDNAAAQAMTLKPFVSDFFAGEGTNGWEYGVHPTSEFTSGGPIIQALQNLAYFAGDPNGGAPSFSPVQDDTVHPYPQMSMWGDFSVLRRIFEEEWNNASPAASYNNLSPADKSTLRSAACSVGMLAYESIYLRQLDLNRDQVTRQNLNWLLDALTKTQPEIDAASLRFRFDDGSTPYVIDGSDSTVAITRPPVGAVPIVGINAPPEAFIAGLQQWQTYFATSGGVTEVAPSLVQLGQIVMTREQMRRDREFGFINGQSASCNIWVGASNGLSHLCTDYSKFPTLHALFPQTNHPETNGRTRMVNGTPDANGNNIPDYIDDVNVSAGIQYTAFDFNDVDILDDLALEPKPLTQWTLPYVLDAAVQNTVTPNPTHARDVRIACVAQVCGSTTADNRSRFIDVAFKDTALFNGREMMTSRVLNLNLELMRTNQNNLENGDYWLPNSGIVYGFREDGVREDEIVRPRRTVWGNCDQNATYESTSGPNNANCRVDATVSAESSTDPPLDSSNLISPKAVDYYPDPDRRPHGFRLRNGEKIHRDLSNPKGLSMVSDNPVYIQGSLNLHQTPSCNGTEGCRLEEFTTKLNTADFSNFYSRNILETRFARPDQDLWRPAEILADAITIISDDFCDGSIADGIITASEGNGSTLTTGDGEYNTATVYGCSNNENRTSFLDQNRPNNNPPGFAPGDYGPAAPNHQVISTQYGAGTVRWHHENPYDPASPIAVSRDGNLIEADYTEYGGAAAEQYYAFTAAKPQIGAQTERINAIIISGTVPSRPQQGYGGLHNFPRFISQWGTLHISGAFLQLNFSNYATAPFEQDAWEVNQNPTNDEAIRYYKPPTRRWGYDVALQYSPAGPIASRFVSATAIRSEFYNEPSADDPYMSQLCRAMVSSTGGDPNEKCS